MLLFSIQILIQQVLKNDFSSFWQDLGFECFFYPNSNAKSIENLSFQSFAKILVLDVAFFYSNSN